MDLPVESGVLVFQVEPDSPAEKGGLRGGNRDVTVLGMPMRAGGDILIGVNDSVISNFDDLINYLASRTSVGDVVTLTVVRDGGEIRVSISKGLVDFFSCDDG